MLLPNLYTVGTSPDMICTTSNWRNTINTISAISLFYIDLTCLPSGSVCWFPVWQRSAQVFFKVRSPRVLWYEFTEFTKGDRILVQPYGATAGKWFEGFVHVVRKEEVGLRFHGSFRHIPRQKYNIRFKLNRYPVRRQHQAMDTIFQNEQVLFPSEQHFSHATRPRPSATTRYYNRHIAANEAQAQAVTSILNLSLGSPPFCVFGP